MANKLDSRVWTQFISEHPVFKAQAYPSPAFAFLSFLHVMFLGRTRTKTRGYINLLWNLSGAFSACIFSVIELSRGSNIFHDFANDRAVRYSRNLSLALWKVKLRVGLGAGWRLRARKRPLKAFFLILSVSGVPTPTELSGNYHSSQKLFFSRWLLKYSFFTWHRFTFLPTHCQQPNCTKRSRTSRAETSKRCKGNIK